MKKFLCKLGFHKWEYYCQSAGGYEEWWKVCKRCKKYVEIICEPK